MRTRRPRPHRTPPGPGLMAHLRSSVWGPAEFVGLPPWWLVGEGLLAGLLGAAAVVGAAVVGAWYGIPGLANGEAGLLFAVALAVYLGAVRAGTALVGTAAVLGVCLALQAPSAAGGLVLEQRGRVAPVVVTSVEGVPAADPGPGGGRYLCSVAHRDGVPLEARIRRGCGRATRPGDMLTVVYDPKGWVPPRGVVAGSGIADPVRDLGGWAVALVGACVLAVVRSYRLSVTGQPPEVLHTVSKAG